jgi:hypothetical protein
MKTGTAHSILKTLPLLDHLADDAQKPTWVGWFCPRQHLNFFLSHVEQRTSSLSKVLTRVQYPKLRFQRLYIPGLHYVQTLLLLP